MRWLRRRSSGPRRMIEEGSSFSGSSLSGQAPVAGRSQILLHRRPSLPLKRAFAHLDDKAQHTDMSWSASSCRLHRMDSNPYLTPARVSDHLFNPQGNKTTIAPKRIIAYIWDIISIHCHLRSIPHLSRALQDYKFCGQIVKIIL